MGPWPETLARVPYWVYQDPGVLADEQRRIFEGPVWNFLCLEIEIPKLVYERLGISTDRHWDVSIHPGSIQVLPGR